MSLTPAIGTKIIPLPAHRCTYEYRRYRRRGRSQYGDQGANVMAGGCNQAEEPKHGIFLAQGYLVAAGRTKDYGGYFYSFGNLVFSRKVAKVAKIFNPNVKVSTYPWNSLVPVGG